MHRGTTNSLSCAELINSIGNLFMESFATNRKCILLAIKPHAISSACLAVMQGWSQNLKLGGQKYKQKKNFDTLNKYSFYKPSAKKNT